MENLESEQKHTSFNYQEWKANAEARLLQEYPQEHQRKDIIDGGSYGTLGYVFWPTENRGFFEAHHLIKLGNILLEINKPIEDDYERSFKEWIDKNIDEELNKGGQDG